MASECLWIFCFDVPLNYQSIYLFIYENMKLGIDKKKHKFGF